MALTKFDFWERKAKKNMVFYETLIWFRSLVALEDIGFVQNAHLFLLKNGS